MIRRLVFAAIVFFAPIAIYFIYRRLFGRDPNMPAPRLVWVFAAVLALGSMLISPLLEPRGNARYVPAHMDADGHIVPDRETPAP